MSRNDSILYAGSSSASFSSPKEQAVKERQKLSKQERLENQHKLKPAAEPVLALIDKHKKLAMHVASVASSDLVSDKEAGEMLRSQRRIYAFLLQFEQEIKIALKDVT